VAGAKWPARRTRARDESKPDRSSALLEAKLSIDVSPVTHRRDVHKEPGIIDAVNNALISHPNSPQIFRALELLAAGGSWRYRQCFNAAKHPSCYLPVKRLQLLSSRPRKGNRVLRHEPGAWWHVAAGA
jgi:hypothetical protein